MCFALETCLWMTGDRETVRKHGKAAELMTRRWHAPRRAFSLVIISRLFRRELYPFALLESPPQYRHHRHHHHRRRGLLSSSSSSSTTAAAYGEQRALRNRAGSLCNRCVKHLRSASELVRACMPMIVCIH